MIKLTGMIGLRKKQKLLQWIKFI